MKRNELTAGETYAYRSGSYGGFDRVRVIDTENVYRQARGGYSTRKTDNKDGIRVVFETGSPNMFEAVNAEQAENAKLDPNSYKSLQLLELFDGMTEDGEIISRVLPRWIDRTWAEAEEAKAQHDAWQDEYRAKEDRKKEDRKAAYAKLPEEWKSIIKISEYGDASYHSLHNDEITQLVNFINDREGS